MPFIPRRRPAPARPVPIVVLPPEYRAAVDTKTGQILYGQLVDPADPNAYDVEPGLSKGQIRVVLDRAPDTVTERIDLATHAIRAANPQELEAAQTTALAYEVQVMGVTIQQTPALAALLKYVAHLGGLSFEDALNDLLTVAGEK